MNRPITNYELLFLNTVRARSYFPEEKKTKVNTKASGIEENTVLIDLTPYCITLWMHKANNNPYHVPFRLNLWRNQHANGDQWYMDCMNNRSYYHRDGTYTMEEAHIMLALAKWLADTLNETEDDE